MRNLKVANKPFVLVVLTFVVLFGVAGMIASCYGKPAATLQGDTTSHRSALPVTGNSVTSTVVDVVTEPSLTGQSVEPLTGLSADLIIAMTRDKFGERYDEAGRKKGVTVTTRKGMQEYAYYGQVAVAEEIAGLRDKKTRETTVTFAGQLREIPIAYSEALSARGVGTIALDFRSEARACAEETLHTVVNGIRETALRDTPRSSDLGMVAALVTRLHRLAEKGTDVDHPLGAKELGKLAKAITEVGPFLGRLPEKSAVPVREMLKSLVSDLEDVTQ